MQGLIQQQWVYFPLADCLIRERDEEVRICMCPWLSKRDQESVDYRLERELALEGFSSLQVVAQRMLQYISIISLRDATHFSTKTAREIVMLDVILL